MNTLLFVKQNTREKVSLKIQQSNWTLEPTNIEGASHEFTPKSATATGWFANNTNTTFNCDNDAEDPSLFSCATFDGSMSVIHTQDPFATTKNDDWQRFAMAWPVIGIYAEEALTTDGTNQIDKLKFYTPNP